jgi:hypothetical protein
MVDPFGWQAIGREKLADVRAKLAAFESMTWNEILIDRKKQNHSIEIWQLCKEAQDRLSELGLADVERIISLRLSGLERIWGLRQGVAMLVLWWDPDHQICPSILKHT